MTISQVKEVSEKMKKSLRKLYRGLKQRKGQSLVEYALILALIAVVAILVLRGIGGNVNNKLIAVNSNLQ
jgi:Flp pilus assembly pilin Flp